MTGILRVQVGDFGRVLPWPHRVVFGRRPTQPLLTPFGQTFVPLGDSQNMSREWFAVKCADVTTPHSEKPESCALVRCLSNTRRIQIWEGRAPVPVEPGGVRLVSVDEFYVGDYVTRTLCGAHVTIGRAVSGTSPIEADIPNSSQVSGNARPHQTLTGSELILSAIVRNLVLARYHGYYRLPPDFFPQPMPWEDVAETLGYLDSHSPREPAERKKAIKRAEDPVHKLRQRIDKQFPGRLPPGGPAEKSFHDALRMLLEGEGVFRRADFADFDRAYPRALEILRRRRG